MRVSVETTGSLERKVTIAVPSELFEEKIEGRLRSTAKEVKLAGFRPSKVPLREVRRRFGKALRQEVASELVQTSFAEAVRREDLAPAGQAAIEILNLEAGSDLEFTATFEVLPEFDLADLATLRVRRPSVEIEEADIDRTVESLRERRTQWNPVQRPAAERDRAIVDYAVRVDGRVVEEGEGEAVIVGEASSHAELVAAVSGMSTDETRAFPMNYRETGHRKAGDDSAHAAEEPVSNKVDGAGVAQGAATEDTEADAEAAAEAEKEIVVAESIEDAAEADPAQLPDTPEPGIENLDDASASRQAICQVTVRAIEEPSLPTLDDEFFDWFGVDSDGDRMGKFRVAVRERMQVELDVANRRTTRQEVMSALAAAHDFYLPKVMVDAQAEIERERFARIMQNLPPAIVEACKGIAEERVRTQLVVGKIAAQESMRPDDEQIRARIDEIASAYEDADGVRTHLYGDEDQLNRIEAAVLEDQVVEHVLSLAQVATEQASYQDAVSGTPFPEPEPAEEASSEDAALPSAAADQATGEVVAEQLESTAESTKAPVELGTQAAPVDADEHAASADKEAPSTQKAGIVGNLRRLFGSRKA